MLMNKKKSFIIRHRFLLVSLLCLFGVCVVAQVKPAAGQQKKVEKKSDDSAKNKKGTAKKKPVDKRKRVDLLHADEAQADKLLRPDVQVLIGSVKLRHDSMYMYCDSASFTKKQIRWKRLAMSAWNRVTRCLYTEII